MKYSKQQLDDFFARDLENEIRSALEDAASNPDFSDGLIAYAAECQQKLTALRGTHGK